MVNVLLTRACSSLDGTFGVLSLDGAPLCVTCEEPWLDNQVEKSCIPTGVYTCQKYSGTKWKNVWQVMDVPGRTGILIHIGNTILDIEGCILVGQFFTRIKGLPAIGNSSDTFKMLKTKLPDVFTLTIK